MENISSGGLGWTHLENISIRGSPTSPWQGHVWLCWTIDSSSLSLFCSPLCPGMKTFKIGKKIGFQFHCEKLHLVIITGNKIPSFLPWYHFWHFIDFCLSSGLVINGMRTPGSGDTRGVEYEKLLEILGGRERAGN